MVKQATSLAASDAISCCSPIDTEALSEHDAVDIARVFAALSDPIRLRLLSLVASAEEVCSCDLEAPLERSQPTISHHTRILSEAGLIIGEKRGRWVWWSVNTERLEQAARILSS
jgi:ArsR family transcriptional regulator, arsenate/arsenite/antimonite-responsive transcriptional repressor